MSDKHLRNKETEKSTWKNPSAFVFNDVKFMLPKEIVPFHICVFQDFA